jgi:hypothetical protein
VSTATRKTRDGSFIVPVDDLKVGDRMRFTAGRGRAAWWPIIEIEEFPKTRRVTIGVQSSGQIIARERMRRTTMVARAPREGEAA